MRVGGWRDALSSAGIEPESGWLRRGEPNDLEFVRQIVEESRPEAIVCANDLTAARLMQTLLKLGLAIPEDIRVVGVDDAKRSDLLAVPLTTLRQPCRELGIAAFAAMLQRIERPSMPARDILLDCELIVRQSCGAGEK
jgi:DNA-binding LacI/PurR family transcriptional regulator